MSSHSLQYDAIILAGRSAEPALSPTDSRFSHKALLDIAGKPMLRYVAEALCASGRVRRLILVGLKESEWPGAPLSIPVIYIPSRGAIVDNCLAALEAHEGSDPVVFASTDVPLLSPEAVNDFLNQCETCDADLCYPIIRREVMEARFPGSGRTFTRLVEGQFCGGDIFRVRPRLVAGNIEFARSLTASRKSPWRLAKIIGLGVALRFATHRLRLIDAERRVSRVLGGSCKAISSSYAELGMDVDKQHHLEVVLRDMGRR